MKKSSAIRLAGFVGALCVSGALIGTAVSGTGAYFTDSKDGSISGTTGSIKIDASGTTMNFTNLLPGAYQHQQVNYTNTGSNPEDVWLVFPNSSAVDAFIHTPQDGPTPLGRYGHFALSSSGGAHFVSNNLSLDPAGGGTYNTSQSCGIDQNGEGGSNQLAASKADHTVPFCAPMHAILLQQNLASGNSGDATLEFGVTQILTSTDGDGHTTEGVTEANVPFQIVATQQGIRPDDTNAG